MCKKGGCCQGEASNIFTADYKCPLTDAADGVKSFEQVGVHSFAPEYARTQLHMGNMAMQGTSPGATLSTSS